MTMTSAEPEIAGEPDESAPIGRWLGRLPVAVAASVGALAVAGMLAQPVEAANDGARAGIVLASADDGKDEHGDDDEGDREAQEHSSALQDFVHGVPASPSRAWTLAAGGRIYDKWWAALDRDAPGRTNPAYPEIGQKTGNATWRCKECHAWDYLGKDGIYGEDSSHYTGINGVLDARGMAIDELMTILRDRNHPYTTRMISDDEMRRVAMFISEGLVDMREFIDLDTRSVKAGDTDRGREIYQTTCAACHGFDGRALDFDYGEDYAFVGTEASELPDEVFSKLSNAHPGAAMINTRAFPVEDRISLLAYIATLPTRPDIVPGDD